MSDDENDNGGGNIQVFARIRPAHRKKSIAYQNYHLNHQDKSIEFEIPRDTEKGHINNTRELFKFKFNHIFEEKTTQEDVFNQLGITLL